MVLGTDQEDSGSINGGAKDLKLAHQFEVPTFIER